MLTTTAQASTADYSPVTFLLGMHNGSVLFVQTGVRSTPPNCGAPNPTRWALDANTTAGQEQLAILLTAKATGKTIQINGTGDCSVWGDTETVDYITVSA